jgi:hypothetical protein
MTGTVSLVGAVAASRAQVRASPADGPDREAGT